jgi:RNA polymerase sigma factor (sigma-70 family)
MTAREGLAHAERHREAFTAFFCGEFRALVLHVAVNAGANRAADAAQEAMVEALRRWDQIKEPRAWVRKVAVRIALERARTDDNRRTREQAYVQRDAVHRIDPEERTEITEEQAIVLARLREMPPARREVVALIFDGFSAREAANRLGIAESTVRSHLRHARRALEVADLAPEKEVCDEQRQP